VPWDEALHRSDLRELPFVTIDGKDARDFDDAVCLVREGGGFRLFVAIADVAHYVEPGSPLDREAYLRGTSVYFPDRCIPMLPPELSEGVQPETRGEPSCDGGRNSDPAGGTPGTPSFHPSVIRSRARLTYDEVHSFLGTELPRWREERPPAQSSRRRSGGCCATWRWRLED